MGFAPAVAQELPALTLQHAYTVNRDGGQCIYGFLITAAPDQPGGFQQIDIAVSAVTDEPVNREIRHLEIAVLGKPAEVDWIVREATFLCGVPEITLISAHAVQGGGTVELMTNSKLVITHPLWVLLKPLH